MGVEKKEVEIDASSSQGASGADDSGPVDLGAGESAPRRKKRGGLRVPSDNVPRPGGRAASSSQPASDAEVSDGVPHAGTSNPDVSAAAVARFADDGGPVPGRGDTEPGGPGPDLDVDLDIEEDAQGHAAAAAGAEAAGDAEVLADEDLLEDRSSGEIAAVSSSAADTVPQDPSAETGTAPGPGPATLPGPGTEEEELSPAEIEEVDSGPVVKAQTSPPTPPPKPPAPPAAPRAAHAAAAAVAAQQQRERPQAKKRKSRAWYEEIFDEDYLRTLPFLTPQATQREASFLVDALAVKPGAHLLDLGCGYGRHAMELAARGYHVAGLDLSLPLLIRGADEAQRRGLTINFVHGDMRELTFEAQFDAAYCVFSTFGYFDDETNKRVVGNVARALKPGGRLLIDVLNRDYIVDDLPTRVWWEGDGCVVLEEVDFNYYTSRISSNRSVVFEDGRQLEQEISMRAYSLHELGKLLHQAGFRVTEVSGGFATRGQFFGSHSRQIIVVAERRPPEATTPMTTGGTLPPAGGPAGPATGSADSSPSK